MRYAEREVEDYFEDSRARSPGQLSTSEQVSETAELHEATMRSEGQSR